MHVTAWVSVSVIAAYLTFFPVVIATLRGLHAADHRAVELMRSYAANRWTVLWKLRFPTSLPYLFSALQVSATASIVGAIIGESPSSIAGGLGGAILNFAQYYSFQPQNLWADEHRRRGARHRVLPRRRRAPRSSSSAARRSTSHDGGRDQGRLEAVQGRHGRAQDIDLEIEPGEFISLIGPSGCGKSTLLRIIGDLIEPSARRAIDVNGKPARQARRDHDYGIVFQDAVLYDWRTVAKNIALPLELAGWDQRAAADSGSTRCSTSSSSRASASTIRGSSPAACSSGSRSRARSRSILRSC